MAEAGTDLRTLVGGRPATPHRPWSARRWIGIYAGIFVFAQVALFVIFVALSGESRTRAQMLRESEVALQEGRAPRALEILEDFGRRWPGAQSTRNFNERLAEAHAANDDWTGAATHWQRALGADRNYRGLRARAGEALWKSGRKDEAVALLREELRIGERNNARAMYYLGLHALESGDPVTAWSYFQSMPSVDEYAEELKRLRLELDATVLKPAEDEALRRL